MAKDRIDKSGWNTPFDKPDVQSQNSNQSEQIGARQKKQLNNSLEHLTVEMNEVDSEKTKIIGSQISERSQSDLQGYLDNAQSAMQTVDTIVSKSYLEKLVTMDVLPPSDVDESKDLRLFKIDLMAYEKDEYATDKFISVISAMTYSNNSLFMIIDGFKEHVDFYIGIKNEESDVCSTESIASTFEDSIKGQFPGIKLTSMSEVAVGENSSPLHKILRDIKEATCISSYAGVPSLKGDGKYTNANYIQGIEKYVDAMQGKRYTAIIIARNQMPASITALRNAYEDVYSQLSCLTNQQLSCATNEAIAHAVTRSQGIQTTINHTVSSGKFTNITQQVAKGTSIAENSGYSKQNGIAKASQTLANPMMVAGALLTLTGAGAPLGGVLMAGGAGLKTAGVLGGKTINKGTTTTENINVSKGSAKGENTGVSDGKSEGETLTDSEGNTYTIGSNKNYTITLHNKHVEEILKKIEKQLERIDQAEGYGMWSTSTYILSYKTDYPTAQSGAAIFRSNVQGGKSGIEKSAINTWISENDSKDLADNNGDNVLKSVTSISHPIFRFKNEMGTQIDVDGTSLISSSELALILSLPRKSVPGLPVIEHLSLGREVVKINGQNCSGDYQIGNIFDHGFEYKDIHVMLDSQSMTQHTFVTGSTGCGKSETIYRLIHEASKSKATYLVIEPAKGEYKSVLNNVQNVFGTNPLIGKILRINPFRFPEKVHVLEHIDRLVDIFNVCWPMYAAMPAVLKKSVIRAYENCGWNLYNSTNKYGLDVFPSFYDLLCELNKTINESAYSEEVKGNYIGSLVTRIESLTNGLNGEIFSVTETGDSVLFDQNTIVDLSRVGAQETKALIMGILIMRLNEYRASTAEEPNASLKHITVLEEAHNILTRTSTEQSMEDSNVVGKSVEMLINSIAEMRTYGEGFIIVDQSPTSVHSAAIKNTNTKIIMRLPDAEDRRIVGKSAALKDNQIDELAKLQRGVAVIYQNDWMQPVMCSVAMIDDKDRKKGRYVGEPDRNLVEYASIRNIEVLKFLLKGRMSYNVEPKIDTVKYIVENSRIAVANKMKFYELIKEYNDTAKLNLWSDDNFVELSAIVSSLFNIPDKLSELIRNAANFDSFNLELTDFLTKEYDIPDYMNNTLKQVLLRNYAELGESQMNIYRAWLDYLINAKQ